MARRSTKSEKEEKEETPAPTGSEGDASAGLVAQAQEATDQLQETVVRFGDSLREQAVSRLDDQKDKLSGGVETLSQALRTVGTEIRQKDNSGVAQYIDQAADRLESFSATLNETKVDDLTTKAEQVARQRPYVFLASSLGVGLLASRLFKTSSRNQAERDREREQQEEKLRQLLREEEALQRAAATQSKDAPSSTAAAAAADSGEIDGMVAAYLTEDLVPGDEVDASLAEPPEAGRYAEAVDQDALTSALRDPIGLGLEPVDVAYEVEVEVLRTDDPDWVRR